MPSLRQFATRFIVLFRKRHLEEEMNEEMRAHIDMLTEQNVQRGMAAKEARFAALRGFGGVDQTKEVYRDQRGIPMVETFIQDVRYGLRMLVKNPGFTAVAVITLGLAIGVNNTILSYVQGFLLRRPPDEAPPRVMMLFATNP